MSNAFKAPGSSRANKQQHNNMAVAQGAMPLYNSYADYMKGMQPMLNQGYTNLYNMGMQNNSAAQAEAMQRQAMMSGLMANHAGMNLYGNQSLAQGMGINAMNQGINASNAYTAQQYDPNTQMQHMATALGAMQTPIQNMGQMANIVYGQPQVPVGKSGLDYVMQAAGLYAGSKAGTSTTNNTTNNF
jgi:hypothetical protein